MFHYSQLLIKTLPQSKNQDTSGFRLWLTSRNMLWSSLKLHFSLFLGINLTLLHEMCPKIVGFVFIYPTEPGENVWKEKLGSRFNKPASCRAVMHFSVTKFLPKQQRVEKPLRAVLCSYFNEEKLSSSCKAPSSLHPPQCRCHYLQNCSRFLF